MQDYFFQKYNTIKSTIREVGQSRGHIILRENILELMKLLTSEAESSKVLIPNLSSGELAICADQADIYANTAYAVNIVKKSGFERNHNFIIDDFLTSNIRKKYTSILLFPPMRTRSGIGRVLNNYIDKCLDLLDKNGKLVMVVPQNFLTFPAYERVRARMLNDYSVEAVFSFERIAYWTRVKGSIIVVNNTIKNDKVFMMISNENSSAEEIYHDYLSGTGGFFVDSTEIKRRLDPHYYDPKYEEVRQQIQRRDTVKLGEIADIYHGALIKPANRLEYGDYLIVSSRNIQGGNLIIDDKRRSYCSREYLLSDSRGEKCIIKNGDVLIGTWRELTWAVYHGEDDYIVASQNITIIRGRQGYEGWLKLFFNTKTGIECLESQLDLLKEGSAFEHISVNNLRGMYVPDIKMLGTIEKVNAAKDLEDRVAELFIGLGWEVRTAYPIANNQRKQYLCDIALFDNGILKGIIEVKQYQIRQIENNEKLANQLEMVKASLGNIGVYLFVDNQLYEYYDGGLEQLLALPRPGIEDITKKRSHYNDRSKILPIEKGSTEEVSVSDKMVIEYATDYDAIIERLDRIEGKIDNITEILEQLSKQVMGYQSLVDKQLKMAISPEEEERIIHAFSDECTEKFMAEVKAKNAKSEYNKERNKLVNTIGQNAWKKLDDTSRDFLVSSRITYNHLIELQDIVDYSGVCLLVTKALEVEVGKRFCKEFINYLKEKYPGRKNYPMYPTALLDQYQKPLKVNRFTLGTLAYILCYIIPDDMPEERSNNNKEKLLDYVSENLMSGKTRKEIFDILQDFAESVEEVRKDYRNPSAHTNELQRVDAEACFDLVIDVEKLLKRMLDSFDY